MKANVIEIFPSIQGEGPYAGTRQVFVRFYKCNMHCTWCDTPQSIGDSGGKYQELTLQEIVDQITTVAGGCHSVSLTGGEPLLQHECVRALRPYLKKLKLISYVETNGVLYKELAKVIKDIDIVAMDIKLPSSTRCPPCWDAHKKFLKVASRKEVFIKTVITADTAEKKLL